MCSCDTRPQCQCSRSIAVESNASTDAATEVAPPPHEANAPTAATGTPKGPDGTAGTDGTLSGEVCRQATEALQRLINHLCIVEHLPVPMPIYFQYPPAGFDPAMVPAACMGPPPVMLPGPQPQQQPPPPMHLPPPIMQHRHMHGPPPPRPGYKPHRSQQGPVPRQASILNSQ